GRVVQQIRAMNALDNTLIMFLSDNGASAEIMVRDDGHDPALPPGSAGTHLCLGPGWSTVANTPLPMHQTWVQGGGIATGVGACLAVAARTRRGQCATGATAGAVGAVQPGRGPRGGQQSGGEDA